MVPVAGVLFLGWDTFLLLVLFWAENLVVGFYNVVKMALARGSASPAEKLALIPFFIVHYGMFTMVHGIFVFILFGGVTDDGADFSKFGEIGWGFVALLVSHGVSLVTNYIQGGEYKRTDARMLMMAPYGRVVVLHLTIIASGFLMAFLGAPMAGLLILVGLKMALDIGAHLQEHARYRNQTPAPFPACPENPA